MFGILFEYCNKLKPFFLKYTYNKIIFNAYLYCQIKQITVAYIRGQGALCSIMTKANYNKLKLLNN